MSTLTLLQEDRRHLSGHRKRGIPAFWLGLTMCAISVLGFFARLEGIPEIRSFARKLLSSLPPGGSFYREHFYFTFESAPFASPLAWVGLLFLLWGSVELVRASHYKHELADAEDERRKQQIARELEAEEKASASRGRH
jgi:hypothetical protein